MTFDVHVGTKKQFGIVVATIGGLVLLFGPRSAAQWLLHSLFWTFCVSFVILVLLALRSVWDLPKDSAKALGSVGFAVGGIVGFLLRPSFPGVGQVPFIPVMTRGTNWDGVHPVLYGAGAAETSFNYLIAGCVLGTVGALFVRHVLRTKAPLPALMVVQHAAATERAVTQTAPTGKPNPHPASARTAEERILVLDDLRAKHLITDEEYSQRKADVISSL